MRTVFMCGLTAMCSIAVLLANACTPSDRASSSAQAETRSLATESDWAVLDLTGDGHLDTVRIDRPLPGEVRIRVKGMHLDAEMTRRSELPLYLADFADLDGDGIQDLLLYSWDDASVWAGVALLRTHSIVYPVPLGDPTAAPVFVWDPMAGQRVCLHHLIPIFASDEGRVFVSAAVGESRRTEDCLRPTRTRFMYDDDKLVAVEP